MKEDDKKTIIVLCVLGGILVIWVALLIAAHLDGGLVEVINNLSNMTENLNLKMIYAKV